MQYVEQPAPKQLRWAAESIWRFSFADTGETPQRILPTGKVALVFHARRSRQGYLTEGRLSLLGPTERFLVASDVDGLEVVGVSLSLGASHALFGVNPAAIRGR